MVDSWFPGWLKYLGRARLSKPRQLVKGTGLASKCLYVMYYEGGTKRNGEGKSREVAVAVAVCFCSLRFASSDVHTLFAA